MSSLTHATGLSDINADEVLNSQCKDSACANQAKNPDQTRYYNTNNDHLGEAQIAADIALTDAGKQQLNASDLEQQASQRQSTAEVPDLTDPELVRLSDFVQYSPTLINGISDKYHDCTGGISYQYVTNNRQCIKPTNSTVQTTMSRIHTSNTVNKNTVTRTLMGFKSGTLAVSVPVANAVLTQASLKLLALFNSNGNSTRPSCGKHIPIYLDGAKVGQVSHVLGLKHLNQTYRINQPVNRQSVVFSVPYQSHCNGRMQSLMKLVQVTASVTYQITTPVTGWTKNHNETELRAAGCIPRPMVCTRPNETRTIAGVPVTASCWEKSQTWQCPAENTCQNIPTTGLDEAHMSAGQTSCKLQGQACQQTVNGVCIANRETHRCTTKVEKDDGLVCGSPGTVVCPPNSTKPECQPPRYTTNTSMVEALQGLALQKAITDEFDPENLTFFSGEAKMCSKGALGTFDCCSDDEGWAGKIGAHQCSESAREIAAAKSKKIVIKVGTFCAKKVLGACLRKKESYCLYSSKVARIATTGALTQIGKRLGSPKNPVCRGLTQEDFAMLDFAQMDFSELAADMKSPTIPNTDALKSKFEDFDPATFENHP
ncbi:conjugal transfer protein TraN [Vibrio sp. 10N.261.46.E12]|nr:MULTISPECIES: conjugal transfer protein TraN [unclassified Vibrio]